MMSRSIARRRTGARRGSRAALLSLALVTVSCGALPPDEQPGSASSPVIGGKVAAVCEWPTTVYIPASGCSGTLVHPRVVITAKHCLDDTPPSVSFGEVRPFPRTARVARCFKHPQTDFGFCTLSEDVIGIPIVPVMAPCEMSELKMGAPIVEAGFGATTGGNDAKYGTKKWIAGTIVRASATRTTVDVTAGTQDGEYFGDSGGPLYLNMPDGTWRLIGGDWSSPDWNSSGRPRVSTYTSTPYHVAWAEMQSGIDITPCHDDKGWNPSAACLGSPTNPGEGTGTWTNACAGQTMLLQPTCDGSDGGTGPSRADAGRPPVDATSDARGDVMARSDAASEARADVATSNPVDAAGGNTASDAASQVDTAPPGNGGTSVATGVGGSSGSGSAGTSSGGAAGASGGAAGSSGGAAGTAGVPATGNGLASSEAGCSCETVSRKHNTPVSWLVALAFAGWARSKRRERRSAVS